MWTPDVFDFCVVRLMRMKSTRKMGIVWAMMVQAGSRKLKRSMKIM